MGLSNAYAADYASHKNSVCVMVDVIVGLTAAIVQCSGQLLIFSPESGHYL